MELPNDFTTNITANATAFVSELAPIATLIIGTLLAVVVIGILIKMIKN